jgi:hypothetical protein
VVFTETNTEFVDRDRDVRVLVGVDPNDDLPAFGSWRDAGHGCPPGTVDASWSGG